MMMFKATGCMNRRSRGAMAGLMAASLLALAGSANAQVPEGAVKSLGAPDKMQTSIGTLEFWDGAPTTETAKKARRYDRVHSSPECLQQQLPWRIGLGA